MKGYTIEGVMERRGQASRMKNEISAEVKQLETRIEELKLQRLSIIQDIDASEQVLQY